MSGENKDAKTTNKSLNEGRINNPQWDISQGLWIGFSYFKLKSSGFNECLDK